MRQILYLWRSACEQIARASRYVGTPRGWTLGGEEKEWEDLPYLAKSVGENHLIVGSDWGHHGGRGRGGDPSGQPEVFANMRSRKDVPGSLIAKMLSDNPRTFYALPPSRR